MLLSEDTKTQAHDVYQETDATAGSQTEEPAVEKTSEPVVIHEPQRMEPHPGAVLEPAAISEVQPGDRHMAMTGGSIEADRRQKAPSHEGIRRVTPPPRRTGTSQTAISMKNWEEALPGNWLSRIGIVALFIGLGFLAKMAYDRDWIGPVFQLLIGLLFGSVLLGSGYHWSARYRVWAQAMTGGSIAVLYLSLFASYALHDLMGFFPTFALMFLVTIGAVILALRQESMAVAIIGIVGAFLVPVILGASDYSSSGADSGESNPALLISYILLLDAGVLWLSTLRNWRWFVLLGFVGSLMVYGMWYSTSGDEISTLAAHGALTAIFAFFAAATMLYHVIWRRIPEPTDLALMTLNAAIYFGVTWRLLWDDYSGWLGLVSFLLAGFYGILAFTALRVSPDNRRLYHFAMGIAIVFLTAAIPAQLQRVWITVAWAAEGAVLFWIATREDIRQLQLWGLGIFALVLIHLFAFDISFDQADFRPIRNSIFLPFAVTIGAFYAAAYFLRQGEKAIEVWFFPLIVLTANFLTVFLFSAEIVNSVGSRIIAANLENAELTHIHNLENGRNLGLVSLWAVYGISLVAVGLWKDWKWLRPAGYALLVITAGTTLILLNYGHASIDRGISTPILNYSFGAFAISTVVLYLAAYMVAKNSGRIQDNEMTILPALIIGANFLSLWALSSEVHSFVGSEAAKNNARDMSLAILWAVYGFGLVIAGLWRGWVWLRGGGYLLLLISGAFSLTVLNYGSAMIAQGTSTPVLNPSFGAFAIGAVIFYLTAHIMAQNRDRVHSDERVLLPGLLVGANFLTLWAFSSEILTFVGTGHGKNMGLTMLWAIYGLALIGAGIAGRWQWIRIGGLALVSVAIIKLFIFDTFTLESGYRVAAYLTLGALLLAGGFVYHKYADVIKGLIFEEPQKIADSNDN
jgi:uncharacterized membrane protein